ncbi:YHS domain-containing protein [Stappia sp. F7233]|uniref:YHS domain-containing protein n=1 Tax=Stappia albiluteola TaxID=2758565 RepID=A0A839AIE1_9HYPH|nr:YHS domain-containing (seleno)protein [Stappia albiluteola]MBA5778517.1 YHS domain-containing protein [Stappia albiluteola]
MKTFIRRGLIAAAFAATLATNALAAGFDVNATSTGLALRGVDPVSYFTAGHPVDGKVDIVSVYNGATYRFASEDNKKAFDADPAKYAPQFGGYCAYGMALGLKFDGDPELWKIVDGKLYLNLSPKVVELWSEDTATKIHDADGNWTKVKDASPADLLAKK